MSEEGELTPSPDASRDPCGSGLRFFNDEDDDVICLDGPPMPPVLSPNNGNQWGNLFSIDTSFNATEEDDDEIQILNVSTASTASTKSRKSLSSSFLLTFTPSAEPVVETPVKKKNGCFNCDGDHSVNECSEPKNIKRIKDNAAKFKRESMGTPRTPRVEGASKLLTTYRPGRISNDLRDALDIGPHDIPPYIYRMRESGYMEGYPPAYLKQAMLYDDPTAILSFNYIDANLNQKEDEEEETKAHVPPRIDQNKIIYYAGFNKYFPNLRDADNGKYRVPNFESFVKELEAHIQKDAKSEWENHKRHRSRKRQQFSISEEPTASGSDQPSTSHETPAKRARLAEGSEQGTPNPDVSMNETYGHSANDCSLLSLNEASMCSTDSEALDMPTSLGFDETVIIPEGMNATPFNETAHDLSRFSVGIQPFQETIEHAQGNGTFFKNMLEILNRSKQTKEDKEGGEEK
ncbi:hypothetical protein L596_018642 [Steinernema carpocapsae]|uniref:PSP proline-rich domain-containing protein n=1 Tax=Steinernema carpocapsae TaxID=34508 RepID=A0A4U5N5S0_STECR|nr:hypothetical protein L596_018642 [Steinernema carpocapsae]